MSLFGKAIDNRSKIVNKNVNKVVNQMAKDIKRAVKKGALSTEFNIRDIGIFDLPNEVVDSVYEVSAKTLNSRYDGEVNVAVEVFYRGTEYKILKATIIKK